MIMKYLTFTGSKCIVCGVKKSPSQVPVPLIHVGKYRTFAIHKSHVTAQDDFPEVIKFVEELAVVKEKETAVEQGDYLKDSQDKEEEEEEEVENLGGPPLAHWAAILLRTQRKSSTHSPYKALY